MTEKTDIRDSDEKVVEIEMERLQELQAEQSQNGCRWNAFHVLKPGKF